MNLLLGPVRQTILEFELLNHPVTHLLQKGEKLEHLCLERRIPERGIPGSLLTAAEYDLADGTCRRPDGLAVANL